MQKQTSDKPAAQRAAFPVVDYLTTAEAQAIAGCCRKTILDWCRDERFKSWRAIPSGTSRRRIDRATFFAFLGIPDEGSAK